jgi:hypothetical protein
MNRLKSSSPPALPEPAVALAPAKSVSIPNAILKSFVSLATFSDAHFCKLFKIIWLRLRRANFIRGRLLFLSQPCPSIPPFPIQHSPQAGKAAFPPNYFHFCKSAFLGANRLLPGLDKGFFAVTTPLFGLHFVPTVDSPFFKPVVG